MLAEAFKDVKYDEKEALIEGILYKRDLVAFGGRRRNGKTSMAFNIAVSLAAGKPDFLGFGIPQGRRVQCYLLEDEPGEFQSKYVKVYANLDLHGRLDIIPRDALPHGTVVNKVENLDFLRYVKASSEDFGPDLIIMDNLTFLIGADFNNAAVMQKVHDFAYDLAEHLNCAIIIPAHVRKASRGPGYTGSRLRDDPEGWFEEITGSSNFINTFGSLWGIEKDSRTDRADFCGGTQRLDGQHVMSTVSLAENGWFVPVDDLYNNWQLATDTVLRKQAWAALPKLYPQTQSELRKLAEMVGMSRTAFENWWRRELVPKRLVEEVSESKWVVKEVKTTGKK